MATDTDILIVGGGLNGTALAIALAQSSHRIVLADKLSASFRSDPAFDGRGYSLALASVRMLSALGIWEKVAEFAQPILDIKVSDGRAGEGAAPWFLHFDHAEIKEGPMGHMLEDRYLRRALLETAAQYENIEPITDDAVVDQVTSNGSIKVSFASGKCISSLLVVGCDGRRSQVAQRAGISRTGWDYHQTSLVCAVEHDLPHNGCAHQFFMPAGPLAILPLPGNKSSIVWTESTHKADEINALSDEEFLACLRPCFGDFLGEIKLSGKRFSYPLGLSLVQNFVSERLALVGDAAHGMHPIAGQGLNMGLRDVAALTEVLTDARRRGEDIGVLNVLERYQQWRRFDTATMAVATDKVNRIFSNDNPVLRTLRDLGLGSVNALPSVRRGLIRQAAGLSGDLPKLMQGRPV
ncbi:MAG: 2-octaprenyl-6-methoxyphenyl hydroxylase [Rhodobacteraceae bacterium]|nr:2-octaprenyl-6-methoxyphenyl hydroxylase [Paracoccaceae bacterium]